MSAQDTSALKQALQEQMELKFCALNLQILNTLQSQDTATSGVIDKLGTELTDLLVNAKDIALTACTTVPRNTATRGEINLHHYPRNVKTTRRHLKHRRKLLGAWMAAQYQRAGRTHPHQRTTPEFADHGSKSRKRRFRSTSQPMQANHIRPGQETANQRYTADRQGTC